MRRLNVAAGAAVMVLLAACGAGGSVGERSVTVAAVPTTSAPSTSASFAVQLQLSSSTPSVATSPGTPVPTSATVTLEAPRDGAPVRRCEVFRGRAVLPPTRTIVLGMRNLDNHDPTRYFEMIDDWEYPKDVQDWKGFQWFGSGDSSVGQRFRVEVLVVDLDEVKRANAGGATTGWHGAENPRSAEVVAHVTLKRVAGAGPQECS